MRSTSISYVVYISVTVVDAVTMTVEAVTVAVVDVVVYTVTAAMVVLR